AFAPEGEFIATGRAVGSLVGWTLLGAVVAGTALAYGSQVDAAIERVRSGIGD
ncbi:copper ABC transporter permease, partial [Halorubrum sp. E3]